MMIGMLPNILLSGFIFPIENMPAFFQYLTMIFPARWFVLVIRGCFLRGSDLIPIDGSPVGHAHGLPVCYVAVGKFKKDVEP